MRRLLLAGLLLFAVASAQAAEELLLFGSEIVIGHDGVLTVTEAIDVRAEGQQIQRGIYRDFPIGFEDADGWVHSNSFKLTSVTRDGEPDDYRVERGSKFVRIYIGKEDVLFLPRILAPGADAAGMDRCMASLVRAGRGLVRDRDAAVFGWR